VARKDARVKTFTVTDDLGMQSVLHKSHAYEPLQYLLTVLNLLSYTPVQTDCTCFWWDSETVLEEIWCEDNMKLLLRCVEVALEHVSQSTPMKQADRQAVGCEADETGVMLCVARPCASMPSAWYLSRPFPRMNRSTPNRPRRRR
jgi:hypothetical protein